MCVATIAIFARKYIYIYTQTPSPVKPSHGTPQGRGEDVGHETPGRDTEKETKEMGYTRREMERMATDRKRWFPWSMAYAPNEQTGISK